MSKEDQELMERYIYQVVRRLPKAQQKEVGMELQELISDMMEQTGSMEQVLEELGDPAEFAKSYRDDGHCLIVVYEGGTMLCLDFHSCGHIVE